MTSWAWPAFFWSLPPARSNRPSASMPRFRVARPVFSLIVPLSSLALPLTLFLIFDFIPQVHPECAIRIWVELLPHQDGDLPPDGNDRHVEGEPDPFLIQVVAATVDYAQPFSAIDHTHQAEASFAAHGLVTALTVRSAFDRAILIKGGGGEHGRGRPPAGGVIRMAAVVGRQHVSVSVQNTKALDGVLFDKIRDFMAFEGKARPVVVLPGIALPI